MKYKINCDYSNEYFSTNMTSNPPSTKRSNNKKMKTNIGDTFSKPLNFLKKNTIAFSEETLIKDTFKNYLNGTINMKTFLKTKNFPTLQFMKNNNIYNRDKIVYKKIRIKKEDELENDNFYFKKKLKKEEEEKKKIKAQENFKKIRNVLLKRVNFKKKIRNELEKNNKFHIFNNKDSKLIKSLTSITNHYINKISNKDLWSENDRKKFYETDCPKRKLFLTHFTMKKEKRLKSSKHF